MYRALVFASVAACIALSVLALPTSSAFPSGPWATLCNGELHEDTDSASPLILTASHSEAHIFLWPPSPFSPGLPYYDISIAQGLVLAHTPGYAQDCVATCSAAPQSDACLSYPHVT